MRITQNTPVFEPITILLEGEAEASALLTAIEFALNGFPLSDSYRQQLLIARSNLKDMLE